MSAPERLQDTDIRGCWDGAGASIPCIDTGQDGEIQAGVDWAAPRFTDNGDGTVTDGLTGRVWLKDIDCFGERTWALALGNGDGTVLDTLTGLIWLRRADCFETDWEGALAAAGNLMSGSCDLTDGSLPGDRRLPNVRELVSLIDFGFSVDSLPAGHPFINVQIGSSEVGLYWSSTTLVALPENAWTVGLLAPWTSFEGKLSDQFVWPVRGGVED